MKPKIQLLLAALGAVCAVSCAAQTPIVSTSGQIAGSFNGTNLYYTGTATQLATVTNGNRVTLNCDLSNLTLVVSAPSPAPVQLPPLSNGTLIVDMTILPQPGTNSIWESTTPAVDNATTSPAAKPVITP
jgi:hypothetical protein